MKRIPCFLLTALMLLLCMAFTAGAQEQPLTVAVSGVSGEAGETVTVEVTLTSNPGITSLKLSLSYDATVLTLVESEKTDLFDGWYQASPTTETLPYLMVWVAAEAQTETGTLIRLQFRIAENATVETVSSLTLTVAEAFCDGAEISAGPVRFDISVICRHTYGAYASVDDSEHKRECSKCHEIEKTAHAWDAGVVTKPATHLETGIKTVTCTDCGATKEETVPKDTQHAYGAWTPHNEAQHKQSCACGDMQYGTHSWDAGVVTKPATHLETGIKTFTCTDCGTEREETVPKDTQHAYGAWTPHNETQHKQACACGDVQYGAHVWDAGVVTKPATPLETGIKTFTCTDCGTTREETVPITDESEDPFPSWVIPVIIAVLAVLIAVGVIVLLLMKRRGSRPIPIAPMPTVPVQPIGEAPNRETTEGPHVEAIVTEKIAEHSTDADLDEAITEKPADAIVDDGVMETPTDEGTAEAIAEDFAPQSADEAPYEAPEITADQSEEMTVATESASSDPDADIVEAPAPAGSAETMQKDPDITTSENPTSETEITSPDGPESESDKEEIPITDEQEEFKQ